MGAPPELDPRGPRFNEGVAAGLLLVAFVINQPLVIPAVGTVLVAGSILGPRYGPFLVLYTELIGPRLEPPVKLEDPRPMRVADAFAALIIVASTAAFVAGNINVGWSLALLTVVVTGLSTTTTFCVGCEIYHVVRSQGGRERVDHDKSRLSSPVLPPSEVSTPGNRGIPRWRAQWIGVRTLGSWVSVVGQTSDGGWIMRAGSDRLVLPRGERNFWPIAICPSCLKEIMSVDIARRQKPALCHECTLKYH